MTENLNRAADIIAAHRTQSLFADVEFPFAYDNPINWIDFYKAGHINQYRDVVQIWTNWTPRSTRVEGGTHIVNFGLNDFIKSTLIEQFNKYFFVRPIEDILHEYRSVIRATLGIENPRTDHIEALHKLGYLPIKIYALPEGSWVSLKVPPYVITNTKPEFFWLPNYIETMLSAEQWQMSTSATTARKYREICLKHARRAGETDLGFVDWQCHDFSFRGMAGVPAAAKSGMGHLLFFSGTDTLPAILRAHKYYRAPLSIGGSVPATEHSVICAGGQDGELDLLRWLLTVAYPTGILSNVSDTWDLWTLLTEYIPALKDIILNRDGKLVVRPDSGKPDKILCGDEAFLHVANTVYRSKYYQTIIHPAAEGVLRLLQRALGDSGPRGNALPLINKAGTIYGDSITTALADEILRRTIDEIRLSPYNVVFGVGSYTYQFNTRDTWGWAMKATAARRTNGEIFEMFKKPVTDNGGKFSAKGLLAVYGTNGNYWLKEQATEAELDNCAYKVHFEDDNLLIDPTFLEVRALAREGM